MSSASFRVWAWIVFWGTEIISLIETFQGYDKVTKYTHEIAGLAFAGFIMLAAIEAQGREEIE
jgi:hypothetical protein